MINALMSTLSQGEPEILGAFAHWLLRGGLVLLLGVCILHWSRRTSAATRHTLLAVALISCLALPSLSLFLPSWPIPGVESWMSDSSTTPSPSASLFLPLSVRVPPPTAGVVDSMPVHTGFPTPLATDDDVVSSTAEVSDAGLLVSAPSDSDLATVATEPPAAGGFSVLPLDSGFAWTPVASLAFLLVWGSGVALRCVGRLRSLRGRRLLRRTAQAAEPSLVAVLDASRENLGMRREVKLLMSSSIDIPITWGTWRPIVLLPAAAKGWAPQRLQHILLHELSHVRRCDGLVQAAVWLVVTLRWFDPLAWYAAARLRIEAERACDDNVLLAGGRPAAYAGHLLEIARAASFHGLDAAVAMARTKSALSSRVEAILDRGLVRHSPGIRRHSVIALLGLALVAMVASASVRPERPSRPPMPPDAPEPAFLAQPAPPSSEAPIAPAPQPSLTANFPVLAGPSAVPAPEPVVAPGSAPRPEPPSHVEPMLAPVVAPRPEAAPEPPPIPAVAPVVAMGSGTTHRRTSHTSDVEDGDDAWPYFAAAVDRGDCKPRLLAGNRLGVLTEVEESDWTVEVFHGACRLQVMVRGQVTFGEDETRVSSMARGAKAQVVEETRRGDRKLVILGGPGGQPTFDYQIDDSPQSPADGRSWLAEVLPALYRRTDFRVEERTERLLKRDGVEGVLAELKLLSTDFVVRAYVNALLERASLEPEQVGELLDVVSGMSSDYEVAETLLSLHPSDLATERLRRKFVVAAGSIGSDYELRRVMEHLLARPDLSAETHTALLGLAPSIESDYELAELLVAMLGSSPKGAKGRLGESLFEAMKTIGSDYELHRVLDAAADLEDLSDADLIGLLEVSTSVDSDYELAEFLVRLAHRHSLTGAVAEAYREALDGIGSSHELERARVALASSG